MLGSKFKLNDFLLLSFDENNINKNFGEWTDNKNFDYLKSERQKTHYPMIINPNNHNYVELFKNVYTTKNELAYRCRLFIGTKKLETSFIYLIIKQLNGKEIIFNEVIDLTHAIPIALFSDKETLYSSYIDIFIPQEFWDKNNFEYSVVENVIINNDALYQPPKMEFKIKNKFLEGLYFQFNDLKFESFSQPKILSNFIDFNCEIKDNGFLNISPNTKNNSQTIEDYLIETYGSSGYTPKIKCEYIIKLINKKSIVETFIVSKFGENKFNDINIMFDTSINLVKDINDLPLQINVHMQILVDELLLSREKTIIYNHAIRKPNEIVNNLDISNLVVKEIAERVEIHNQKIVQTPSSKEALKDIVKLPTPIYGIIGNPIEITLFDFNNVHLTFKELAGFNLVPDSKIYLKTHIKPNPEIISGYYSDNKYIYFNITELKRTKLKSGLKFSVELITNVNGEQKISTVLSGKIK